MYGRDVAEIHDELNGSRGKDYRSETEYITKVIRGRNPRARSLLDVGCGAGGHLGYFVEYFDQVEGLELSGDMLAVARAKLPNSPLHQGDMRAFDLGRRFDAIVSLFGSIGHTWDDDELRGTLNCFARHLADGGVVVVEPWWFLEKFINGYVSADVAKSGARTMARVSRSVRSGDVSTMDVHFVVADDQTGVRHFAETYKHKLFSRDQYESAFVTAGFDVEYVEEVQGGRGIFVGVAGKGRS
ncbi:class I SAM-dependent methyltransferase [Actinobacteria bacterium YIM 96077]|uniref:SAM-dependent methyltransferase n=1 Tax=Phytoactinopolyspora halophila TaxID=1981511 RepID=A0A329QCR1_9ACTN|nr:class I SAM-dependent methyltransferase [Phytoactinopolyspora halophila]AYY12659.1 class I SAM-dependent methyltransferase [Actinobacteria bacterium YIM 96077]RAW09549.1 SAM-dependent methyltransferase [Phytoactinopolyspora halophila]